MITWCSFRAYPECSLMFKISGLSPNLESYYRVKIFRGSNKIKPESPISATL